MPAERSRELVCRVDSFSPCGGGRRGGAQKGTTSDRSPEVCPFPCHITRSLAACHVADRTGVGVTGLCVVPPSTLGI